MKSRYTAVIAALGMAVLILDARTALAGAQAGVEVCLQTVVPSLFPFFVLSILLNSALTGNGMPLLRPVERLLRIPQGAMPLILVGLLGGYPVGAQSIATTYRQRQLDKTEAQRMLAFCSNAGPAFLFGMGARLFPELWMCLLVWAIHIASSWLVAVLTPGIGNGRAGTAHNRVLSLHQAVGQALRVLAAVCGWVVLFRILIAFGDRWVLWAVSVEMRAAVIGVVELANGCCSLMELPCLGLRFTLFSTLLSFGGLCVWMQTASVCEGISVKLYLPGKLCQGAISLVLSCPAQLLLPKDQRWMPPIAMIVLCCTVCVVYRFFAGKMQKSSSIRAAAVV